jgi:deoxyadenosine/deoxycytidine kinase
MTVIFAAPAGTGKTMFGKALAEHFGCKSVIEAEQLSPMSETVKKHSLSNALILCQTPEQVPYSPHIRLRLTLDRDQMNRAMVEVGGIPIWNDDGSVNQFGKRKGLGQ